jgi:hypothetical protein
LGARQKCKYALDKPVVWKIWPIKTETNFAQDEIKSLKEVGFVLNKQHPIFL